MTGPVLHQASEDPRLRFRYALALRRASRGAVGVRGDPERIVRQRVEGPAVTGAERDLVEVGLGREPEGGGDRGSPHGGALPRAGQQGSGEAAGEGVRLAAADLAQGDARHAPAQDPAEPIMTSVAYEKDPPHALTRPSADPSVL